MTCHRCRTVNAIANKQCSSCGYPLSQVAYDNLKSEEEQRWKNQKRTNEENSEMIRVLMSVVAESDPETRKKAAQALLNRGSHKPQVGT